MLRIGLTNGGEKSSLSLLSLTHSAPMPITDLVIVSSRVSGSDRDVRLDITWTPPSTRSGIFRTLFTFTGSQTPAYPPHRSNSTRPRTETLGEDAKSFTIMRGLPYAEYTINVQPFNVKTGNPATAVMKTQRTIAIG